MLISFGADAGQPGDAAGARSQAEARVRTQCASTSEDAGARGGGGEGDADAGAACRSAMEILEALIRVKVGKDEL